MKKTTKKTNEKMTWELWKKFQKETKNFTNEKKIEAKLPELKGKWRIHLWCAMNTSVKFIKKHYKEIDWDYYFYNNEHITPEIIDAYKDKWTKKHWNYIVRRYIKTQKNKEELCNRYAEYLDWYDVCEYVKLSEDFMRANAELVNWKAVSRYQQLSEDFINEFNDKLDWSELSINKKVKSVVLRNNKSKTVFHNYYTDKKKVCEDMLHDNANEVNWYSVSKAKRKLSNQFMFEHADKIYFNEYVDRHMVDQEFVNWIANEPVYLAKVLCDWKFRRNDDVEITGKTKWTGSELHIGKQVDNFYKLLAKTSKGMKALVKKIYDVDLLIIERKVIKSNCPFYKKGAKTAY